MEALKVEGLSKNFGGLQVLQDVSFSMESGEHLALIGPNGAGKSTLINLLSGELFATSGKIYVLGHDVTYMPAYRRTHLGLGRSFQIPTVFSSFRLLDAVLFAVLGTKPYRYHMLRPITTYYDISIQAKKLLESMDMWERREEFVHTLSYGELRKMETVLSIASEPRLLLMDEPNAGLTKSETDALVNLIKALTGDAAKLLVAHDMDMVFAFADRIMVLYFGKIIAQGTPKEIRANPMVKEIYLGADRNANTP